MPTRLPVIRRPRPANLPPPAQKGRFCAPTPPSPATYPQNWPYLRTATSFSATYPQNRPILRTAAGFSAAHPQNRPFLRTASPHPKPSPPGSAGLPPCKQKNACPPPPCRSTGSEVPRQPLPPTLPTAPDGAGKRPQAPARPSHRLPPNIVIPGLLGHFSFFGQDCPGKPARSLK